MRGDWERCVEGQLCLPATARVPSEDAMCWGPKCAGPPCWSVGPVAVGDWVGHDCWADGVGPTVSAVSGVIDCWVDAVGTTVSAATGVIDCWVAVSYTHLRAHET